MDDKSAGIVRLVPFEKPDVEQLRTWLNKPHVSRWYPFPEEVIERALSPPDPESHFMIICEGVKVGYVRRDIVSRETLDEIGLTEIPGGSADVDLLIGDEELTGIGVGYHALRLLVERLKAEGVPLAGLTTSEDNVVAHLAFSKAGFTQALRYEPEGFGQCILFTMQLN